MIRKLILKINKTRYDWESLSLSSCDSVKNVDVQTKPGDKSLSR